MRTKTYSQKPAEVTRKWVILDASKSTLGRISTLAATYLIGKNKPTFTPHVDGGDYVIIINASAVELTGKKEDQKTYYRHSGYPGSTKARTVSQQREKFPQGIIINAVKGMLPKNKLQDQRMLRLKVYAGSEHGHDAQKPEKVEVK